MIPLTKRQFAAIKEASKDRLEFANACDYALFLEGKDLTASVEELRVPDQDGPGVVLEGKLATRLSPLLEEEECKVEYLVGGERIPAYGARVDTVVSGAYLSSFLAGTPSRDAGKTPIGDDSQDDLDFSNREPSSVLLETSERMDYEGVEIPRTPEPPFTRTGGDRFKWTDWVSEVYEAVQKEAKLVPEDTPLSVLTARPETSVLGDAEPDWVFEEGRDFEYGDLQTKSREEGRYARVVAWRPLENGSHDKLASAKVDNQGRKVRQDATFFLQLTDAEASGAFEAVYKKATELSENAQELSFPCVYPPFFLMRQDPILVRGQELTPDGKWVREYRARLTSVSWDAYKRTGSLKAVGGLVSEVFVPRPVPKKTQRADAYMALFGFDFLGKPYLDDSLPWVKDDGNHVVIDVEMAAEQGVQVYEDPASPGVVVVGGA